MSQTSSKFGPESKDSQSSRRKIPILHLQIKRILEKHALVIHETPIMSSFYLLGVKPGHVQDIGMTFSFSIMCQKSVSILNMP